jgi:creatinine amidohydrolase
VVEVTPTQTAGLDSKDILAGTIAELTWLEVESATRRGAVLLWAFGVIEQHGPHLPTGTDVYLPSARLRDVRALLAEDGIEALILPPYYWGVNVVSGSFPASYSVRPEIMREVVGDILVGAVRDGFEQVYCFSGHGDALHNATVYEGIRTARHRARADISFVTDSALATRLGWSLDDPALTVHDTDVESRGVVPASSPSSVAPGNVVPDQIDVHAGRWETSMMMCVAPHLVRSGVRAGLEPTNHGLAELAVWRRGFEDARRTTPRGYFGDPASATLAEGERLVERSARSAAAAISTRMRGAQPAG